MSPTQFTSWLYGFVQLTSGQRPTAQQWRMIVEHLRLVGASYAPRRAVTPDHADQDHDERVC